MVEVTRVPLQPIEKGAMLKFWLGVIVGALLAAGVSWYLNREPTVEVDVITAGTGPNPQEGDVVFVEFTGKLPDGTVFDQSPPRGQVPPQIAHLIPQGTFMELSGLVPGFRQAILQMQKGGKYKVEIPAQLAYGANPPPGSAIPPNADLTFEVTLHEFFTQEQLQERIAQINAIMAASQAEGSNGASAAPAPASPPQGQ